MIIILHGYKIIALCITNICEDRNFMFIEGLNKAINKKGYKLFIYHSPSDFFQDNLAEKGDKAVFDLIDYDIIDALIVFQETFKDQSITDEIINKALSRKIKVISLGSKVKGCINFLFDYKSGFKKIVEHVIEYHNIKDTVMIAGVKGDCFSEDRINVYKQVLEENNLTFDDSLIYYGDYWTGPTEDAVEYMIVNNKLPQAIICANDMMAISVCNILEKHSFTVPDDIIVTGFDGTDSGVQHIPPLTTSSFSFDDLNNNLINVLSDLLDNKEVKHTHIAKHDISIYSSCGCNIQPLPINCGHLLKLKHDYFHRYQDDSRKLYELTEKVFACKNPSQVVNALRTYNFYNLYIFLNQNCLDETINPSSVVKKETFDDKMYLLYRSDRSDSIDESFPYLVNKKDVLPELYYIFTQNVPLVFTSLSSQGVAFGYLCVHFLPVLDNYYKIPQFTTSLNNTISGYMNIRYLDYLSKSFEKLSDHDYMTGLLNRKGFYKSINNFRAQLKKDKDLKFILALVDLDGLKKINDQFGHNDGDKAIVAISEAIKTIPIKDKTCVRFGGDEFVICTLTDNVSKAKSIIRRHLVTYLKTINQSQSNPFKTSASIGFSSTTKEDFDLDLLLMKSDKLMYQEKIKKNS